MERASFSFKEAWFRVLKGFPTDVQLEVYNAVMAYVFDGIVTYLDGQSLSLFTYIKNDIDVDVRKAEELAEKRREWGRMGGAPKGNTNASKQPKTTINNQNKVKVVLPQKERNIEVAQDADNQDVRQENNQNKVKVVFGIYPPIKTENKAERKNEKERSKEKEKNKEETKERNNIHTRACVGTRDAPSPSSPTPQPPSPSYDPNGRYALFRQWLVTNAPYIMKHYTNTITEREFDKLMETYTSKELADVIANIENRIDKRKIYTNLYRTALNWLRNEKLRTS